MKLKILPLIFFLVSCGSGSSSDNDFSDNESTTNPPALVVTCTKVIDTNLCNFEHKGLARSFYIHAPAGVEHRKRYLFFLLCMDLEVALKELWDIQTLNLLPMKIIL